MNKIKAFFVAVALLFAFSIPAAGAWKCEFHPEKTSCTGPYPTTTVTVPTTTTPIPTTTAPIPTTTTSIPTHTSSTSTVPPFEIDDVGPDEGTEEAELSLTG